MTGRRELLLQAKIKGLVRSRWGDVVDRAGGDATGFPGGAALHDPETSTAWILVEDDPVRGLGGAVVWADRREATELHLLVPAGASTLARRAAHLERSIEVWAVDGNALTAAEPAPLEHQGGGNAPRGAPKPEEEAFAALFERAGADTVFEHGVLRAEVRGLEVARIVDGKLRVGVGKHDREAQQEVHGDRQGLDELFEVVRIVAEHRVADGAGHAAYHLSPERWLRSVVLRRPDLVGADDDLQPVAPPTTRDDLRQPSPAPARGTDRTTHEPLLVVCSVGTDLDLVPSSVDTYLADGRGPRIRFVLPEGDALRATRDLVDALRPKAELITVSREWRRL